MIFKTGDIVTTSSYIRDFYFVRYLEKPTTGLISTTNAGIVVENIERLVLVKAAHNKFSVGDRARLKDHLTSSFTIGEVTYTSSSGYVYRENSSSQWLPENDLEKATYNINFHKVELGRVSKDEFPLTKTDCPTQEGCPNMLTSKAVTENTTSKLVLSPVNARALRIALVSKIKDLTTSLREQIPTTESAAIISILDRIFEADLPDALVLASLPWLVETFGKGQVPAKIKPVVDVLCKEFMEEGEAMAKHGGLNLVKGVVNPYLTALYGIIQDYVQPEETDSTPQTAE